MKADAVNGQLEALILAIVGQDPAHGYAIVQRLKQRSGGAFDLAEGTVYPALHRLERAGHLRSSWSVEGGRRRRIYELTRTGSATLTERRREWGRFVNAVEAVMG
jgi:PadR family transcriptional regulator, regulatory protein PadR